MTAPSPAPPSTKATVPCAQCQTLNRVDLARLANGPRCAHCQAPLALDHPVPVSDANFDRVVADSPVPVLVDFYADWCGPCKMMAPFVDQLASKVQGQALVAKLDTDHAQRTAGSFNIRGIPTVIVFKGGREVARQSGAVPLQVLEGLLAKA